MKASTWFDALHQCQQSGEAYVLVTVMSAAGSVPRDAGTKMIVSAASQFDTIGGGHLEFEVVNTAREYLAQGQSMQKVVSYPLSSKLGQCCGGAVKVFYEVMANHAQTLAIFGAGHVAKALMPILSQLPLQIKWIDSREALLADQALLNNVEHIVEEDPVAALGDLPPRSWVLILTHNHQLDFELVLNALKKHDVEFIGMIGSQTKAKRFRTRLANRGISPDKIERMVSPIGDLRIPGKRPIEVAVSISAQIISLLHRHASKNKVKLQAEKETEGQYKLDNESKNEHS